jgi:putative ABC transport system ATP-binding protein
MKQLNRDGNKALAIEIRGVQKRFGATQILTGINLEIPAATSVALIGESGSGKSTLLNIIAGLETFDAGSVMIAGLSLSGASSAEKSLLRSQQIGFVFQAFHLMPHLTALQNVMLPLLLQNRPQTQSEASAMKLLHSLGLDHRATALPSQLSGGEQQRVALARAVIHQPAVVLADEPTGNLDPRNAQIALETLLGVVKQSGAALLLVTHSQKVAASADRSVRLVGGTLE